jgi:hypothetical protein
VPRRGRTSGALKDRVEVVDLYERIGQWMQERLLN